MNTLYSLLACMLLAALVIIALPFARSRAVLTKHFFIAALLFMTSAACLYTLIRPAGLNAWLNGGKTHYLLQVQFEQLGGVKGAIASVTAKLTEDPDNIQAWVILGKLYLADHNDAAAQAAFSRARKLQNSRKSSGN